MKYHTQGLYDKIAYYIVQITYKENDKLGLYVVTT